MTIPSTPRPNEKELALRVKPVAPWAPKKPTKLRPRRLQDMPVCDLFMENFQLPPPAVSITLPPIAVSITLPPPAVSITLPPPAVSITLPPTVILQSVTVLGDMAAAEDSRDAPTEIFQSEDGSTRDTEIFNDDA